MLPETLRSYTIRELSILYPESEAQYIAQVLFEDYLGYDSVKQLLASEETVPAEAEANLRTALARLKAGEPLQYVQGFCWFMGHRFKVSPAVLIPRPETEELVDMIAKQNVLSAPRILDLCTGSGCIAISLKTLIPTAEVWALDVSGAALSIAKENAAAIGGEASVQFVQADLLTEGWQNLLPAHFDIIVSNPPYIAEHERASMTEQVLEHEPGIALFVPDANPLLFYTRIMQYAGSIKSPAVYFELNPLYAEELKHMYESVYTRSEIVKDISGNVRFAVFRQ